MRIHIARREMDLLRRLGPEGRPLWDAIEGLRTNPAPPDAIITEGRNQVHVRIGQYGYWLVWEIRQDRGETVIDVALIEQN